MMDRSPTVRLLTPQILVGDVMNTMGNTVARWTSLLTDWRRRPNSRTGLQSLATRFKMLAVILSFVSVASSFNPLTFDKT